MVNKTEENDINPLSDGAATFDPTQAKDRTPVQVFPSIEALPPTLREMLANLVQVRFINCADPRRCGPGEAVINVSDDNEMPGILLRSGAHSYNIPSGHAKLPSAGPGQRIQFGDSPFLDARLRRRNLGHQLMPERYALEVEPGDEVMASHAGHPDWILRKRNGGLIHISSMALPKFPPGDLPIWHLTGDRFIGLLPLVHFLREVIGDANWEKPPLMACLMIDDPNLHWSSYGFLNFEKLLAQVKSAGAHVAFATIPLDAWGFSPKVVRLFRENPRHFSLLYHGNNHTKWEMAQNLSLESWLSVLAQGMTRIGRLEKKTAVPVSRIMVPPHEGNSDDSLLALSTLGFEGACISMGSLYRGKARQFRPTFGLELAEWMSGELPVLHRFGMSSPCCEGDIVISAFLNNPIIPVGHHDTFAKGGELVDSTAALINSFGKVQWGSPSMLLSRNYQTMQKGNTLWIKLYSRRIQLKVPEDVTQVRVVFPENIGAGVTLESTVRNAEGKELFRTNPERGSAMEVRPGQLLEVRLIAPRSVDYRQIKRPGLSYRALARRSLCEGRDRVSPLLARLRGR